jgi:hypothetical protein
VVKPSNGWYAKCNPDTGEVEDKKYRLADTNSKEFWMPILMDKSFYDFVKNKYSMGQTDMIQADDLDATLAALEFEP